MRSPWRRPPDIVRLKMACLFITGAAVGGVLARLPEPVPGIGATAFLLAALTLTWRWVR